MALSSRRSQTTGTAATRPSCRRTTSSGRNKACRLIHFEIYSAPESSLHPELAVRYFPFFLHAFIAFKQHTQIHPTLAKQRAWPHHNTRPVVKFSSRKLQAVLL